MLYDQSQTITFEFSILDPNKKESAGQIFGAGWSKVWKPISCLFSSVSNQTCNKNYLSDGLG